MSITGLNMSFSSIFNSLLADRTGFEPVNLSEQFWRLPALATCIPTNLVRSPIQSRTGKNSSKNCCVAITPQGHLNYVICLQWRKWDSNPHIILLITAGFQDQCLAQLGLFLQNNCAPYRTRTCDLEFRELLL